MRSVYLFGCTLMCCILSAPAGAASAQQSGKAAPQSHTVPAALDPPARNDTLTPPQPALSSVPAQELSGRVGQGVFSAAKTESLFDAAQQAEQAPPPKRFVPALLHNLLDDVKHIPRRNTVYWLAGGAALTAAIHPLDDNLNARLVGSETADALFKPGHVIGATPVQLGATAVTYLVGTINHQPRVRHLGMDLLEAQLLSEGMTQVIKRIVRRERPDNSGFGFPSGHAAITMASATVLQQHLGWKAAVPTYLIASYVAISRLHDNRHFASDVVAGATEGIIVGRAVTWHGRNSWAMAPSFGPGEVAIYIARR